MNSYYKAMRAMDFDLPFLTGMTGRKLNKYAIILNEPKDSVMNEGVKEEPCSLAAELLPELVMRDEEDIVQIIGQILESKIKAHAEEKKISFLKPDEIIQTNSPTLVPVMYRIAQEEFAQNDRNTFKIIECRNVTKLISDWKPSLPDKLISLGHQVVVVQLETSFFPLNDFAYAILRQLDYDWKNRLPRSFFFPDDVCKVETTTERDLCVVSPSMPDGDLEINKKMGLLNYEVLMMIKVSCMSAMKNYLIKRDLRVGKFSDTLDGVSALRQLYRRLQEKLRSGETMDLRSSALDDLKKLVKQSIAGTDGLAAQTWIEYGRKMGLDVPLSKSSSNTSIASSTATAPPPDAEDILNDDDFDDAVDNDITRCSPAPRNNTSLPSSGFDTNDGKDCQREALSSGSGSSLLVLHHRQPHIYDGGKGDVEESWGSMEKGVEKGRGKNVKEYVTNNAETDDGFVTVSSEKASSKHHNEQSRAVYDDEKDFQEVHEDISSSSGSEDDEGFKLEDFMEFRNSLEEMHNKTRQEDNENDRELDRKDYFTEEFTAESIIKMLQLPQNEE